MLSIDAREWEGDFQTVFETEIDPKDYFILKETTAPYESVNILQNGKPSEKVDLVILAEGYAQNGMEKFLADARRVTNYLFDEEPFKSEKDKFNVTAVLTPSVESGTDIPEREFTKTQFSIPLSTPLIPTAISQQATCELSMMQLLPYHTITFMFW